MSNNLTVELTTQLRDKFDKHFSDSLNESSVYVDLSDIHEVASSYLGCIEQLLSIDTNDVDAVQDILIRIQIDLYEHLPLHLKPFEKHLEEMIDSFSTDE